MNSLRKGVRICSKDSDLRHLYQLVRLGSEMVSVNIQFYDIKYSVLQLLSMW